MRHTLHLVISLYICVIGVHSKGEKPEEPLHPGKLINHAFQNNSLLEKFTNESSKPLFDLAHLEGHLPPIPDLNPLHNLGAERLRELLVDLEPTFYRIVQETTVFIGSLVPEIFIKIYDRVAKILPEMEDKEPLYKWELTDWSQLFKKVAFDIPGMDKLFLKIAHFVTKEMEKHPEILEALSPVHIPKLPL